jgi:hypothetical protein
LLGPPYCYTGAHCDSYDYAVTQPDSYSLPDIYPDTNAESVSIPITVCDSNPDIHPDEYPVTDWDTRRHIYINASVFHHSLHDSYVCPNSDSDTSAVPGGDSDAPGQRSADADPLGVARTLGHLGGRALSESSAYSVVVRSA